MENGKYYLGSTRDIFIREQFHKLGFTKTTKGKIFKVVFQKEFPSYQEAYYRERYIKKMKSKKVIEKMISGSRCREKK